MVIAATLSGICLNLDTSFKISVLGSVVFFNLLFNSELAEAITKKVIAIENDRLIIRHLIGAGDMKRFLDSKIKVYFFVLTGANLILTLPVILFGGVINYTGICAAAILFSMIYSLNTTISNALRPNFGNLKNEEVTGSLANDIMDFLLKTINIIIYFSCCISVAPMLYMGKLSLVSFWMILLAVMLVHTGALALVYKKIVQSKVWERWEGI